MLEIQKVALRKERGDSAAPREWNNHVLVPVGKIVPIQGGEGEGLESLWSVGLEPSQLTINFGQRHVGRSGVEVGIPFCMLTEFVCLQGWRDHSLKYRPDDKDRAKRNSKRRPIGNHSCERTAHTKKAGKAQYEVQPLIQPCIQRAKHPPVAAVDKGFVRRAFVGHGFSSLVEVPAALGCAVEAPASCDRPGCMANEIPWFLLQCSGLLWMGIRSDSSSGRSHGISFVKGSIEVVA